jgi:hypothetical protein
MKHEVTRSLKLLVPVYQTTWCHISEDHNLNIQTKELGCAIVQAVSYQPLTMQPWVESQDNPCGICGGQIGTGIGSSFLVSIVPSLLTSFV